MKIEARRFGPPDRQLTAVLQRPNPDKVHRAAFLLCRPFGQESIRTAAIYRAMSDRLAMEGCTVLVFDAHGCGDSPGDPDTQSLDDWAGDTLAADAQLRRDVPGVPVHWYGMGLGANQAVRAVARTQTLPHSLVLREPVFDGPVYMERLKAAHRRELSRELGTPWPVLVKQGRECEPSLPGNVLGYTFGPSLTEDLRRIGRAEFIEAAARRLRLSIAVPVEAIPVAQDWGLPSQALHPIEHPTDWLSTDASGTAIVPPDIARSLLSCLQ